MFMRYKFIKEQLEKIVKESLSIAEVCRKMDIRPVGGNYKTLKSKFNLWSIDISHFTGAAWNQGEQYRSFGLKQPLSKIMIENSTYMSSNYLKKRLIKENIKEAKCEKCGIDKWQGQPITLELDHVNGNNMDNRLENLNILCPNCHSQTDNHRGKNINKSVKSEFRENKIKKIYKICTCGSEIKINKRKYCSKECAILHGRKVDDRPSIDQLIKDVKDLGYVGTGKKYGVSDNAIRKWMK